MQPNYNFFNILLLLAISGSFAGLGATPLSQEFSKQLSREFPITADGFTELVNKYGSITVKTWDQNKVKIDVNIVVQARNQADADAIFNRIQVNFSNTAASVRAVTEITSASRSWWGSWNNSSDFKIHYEVYIPRQGSLTVGAKYCDLATANIGGMLNLDIKYGNFKIDGVDGATNVAIGYGNGTLSRCNNLTLELSYGNVSVGECRDATVDTKYGELNIGTANDLVADSRYHRISVGSLRNLRYSGKYDNLSVGQLNEAVMNAQYTDIKLGTVQHRAEFDMQYGNARIDKLAAGFDLLNCTGQYTDFTVTLAPDARYRIDLATNYSDLTLPSNLSYSHDLSERSSRQLRGQTPNGSDAGEMRVRLAYGGIRLSNR